MSMIEQATVVRGEALPDLAPAFAPVTPLQQQSRLGRGYDMSEQAQTLLAAYIEQELGRIGNISRELMSRVAFMSSLSIRTADELDHIASLFEIDANALRRRAQQLREKSRATA